VDFATTALQNGFSNYKLSPHKNTNINQKITKKVRFFYYFFSPYHRAAVKQDHFMTHFFIRQTPFWDAAIAKSIVM
jgi:hypothetical protein